MSRTRLALERDIALENIMSGKVYQEFCLNIYIYKDLFAKVVYPKKSETPVIFICRSAVVSSVCVVSLLLLPVCNC